MSFESSPSDRITCTCGIPLLESDDRCGRCGRFLSTQRLAQLRGESSEESTIPSECPGCKSSIPGGQKYCSNCGERAMVKELALDLTKDVVCNKCGADLLHNQKFCGGCGVKMDWSGSSKSNKNGVPRAKADISKKKKDIVWWVVGIAFAVIVYLWSGDLPGTGTGTGTGTRNLQEECFEREMAKFGAFADPKGWAIQSRLYCQSLYP